MMHPVGLKPGNSVRDRHGAFMELDFGLETCSPSCRGKHRGSAVDLERLPAKRQAPDLPGPSLCLL